MHSRGLTLGVPLFEVSSLAPVFEGMDGQQEERERAVDGRLEALEGRDGHVDVLLAEGVAVLQKGVEGGARRCVEREDSCPRVVFVVVNHENEEVVED